MRIFTKRKISFSLNLLIIIAAFLLSIWPKSATVRVYLPAYWRPFLGFTAIWLSFAILGGKYNYDLKKKYFENWLLIFRVDAYAFSFILILLYFFGAFSYSRLIVFGTVLVSFAMESLTLLIWYYSQKLLKDKDVSTYLMAAPKEIEDSGVTPFKEYIQLPENDAESVLTELKQIYLKDDHNLLEFVRENSQLDKIPASKTLVMFTHHIYNIRNITQGTQLLFVNLHEVNGWSQINDYLRQVNHNLQRGGYFVSCGEDFHLRYKRFYKQYPVIFATFIVIMDFLFRRLPQSIPVIREIYLAFFQDSRKSFSQCEILGRVAYSGFDIIDVYQKDHLFYFIAQKITDIPKREDPVYGPLIRMKRVGKMGQPIELYKFRTMYPYAEYLQEYLYIKNRLQKGGKFRNDFRIMQLGKVMRRLWIDELPQIYNLLKGELKIVGVRAISPHYFSLYPEEAKELRVKVKPGLVPPFYVDLPASFSEIIESENRYIRQYLKSPFITDFSYFFRAIYNIIFQHARSR